MNLRKDHYRSFHPHSCEHGEAWPCSLPVGGWVVRRSSSPLATECSSLGARLPIYVLGPTRGFAASGRPRRRQLCVGVRVPVTARWATCSGVRPSQPCLLVFPMLQLRLEARSASWCPTGSGEPTSSRSPAPPRDLLKHTTLVDGYLGSRNDEERSEMRYVVRIAEFSESSNL